VNNPTVSEKVKCSISNSNIPEEHNSEEIQLNQVSNKIKELQETTMEPIYLTLESRRFCNMLIIDTPGLNEENESMILDLIKPPQRKIIAVEEAVDWDYLEILSLAKKVDPLLTRTILVLSKFHSKLSTLD